MRQWNTSTKVYENLTTNVLIFIYLFFLYKPNIFHTYFCFLLSKQTNRRWCEKWGGGWCSQSLTHLSWDFISFSLLYLFSLRRHCFFIPTCRYFLTSCQFLLNRQKKTGGQKVLPGVSQGLTHLV